MSKFLLSERYRLELHWKSVVYERDGVCRLEGAYFSGPALKIAERINGSDRINLDFYKQYVIFVENAYVASLKWQDVAYMGNGTVILKDAIITHETELNRVPKFKDTDYIVIDTQKHESKTHHLHLVYESFVVDENGDLYSF
jgi:hypothetical protein